MWSVISLSGAVIKCVIYSFSRQKIFWKSSCVHKIISKIYKALESYVACYHFNVSRRAEVFKMKRSEFKVWSMLQHIKNTSRICTYMLNFLLFFTTSLSGSEETSRNLRGGGMKNFLSWKKWQLTASPYEPWSK